MISKLVDWLKKASGWLLAIAAFLASFPLTYSALDSAGYVRGETASVGVMDLDGEFAKALISAVAAAAAALLAGRFNDALAGVKGFLSLFVPTLNSEQANQLHYLALKQGWTPDWKPPEPPPTPTPSR